jgi:glycerol-3-phosphate dehydrogenase
MEHIVIIGGGVGGALAYDLALRGFRVTLVEKGEVVSGTTGRHHGLLHSGARYVLHDPEAAGECSEENQILKKIAPHAIEPNGGLFIALDEEDFLHVPAFLEGCAAAGIPATRISPQKALAMEPNLSADLLAALVVPDGVMDAFRLAMNFFAGARMRGACIAPFHEVTELVMEGHTVRGIKANQLQSGRIETITADLVVNCTGPWAGRIAAMAGAAVPVQPMPGVMVSVAQRLTQKVINRLHPAGEGDIVVPQRRLSILGTTAWPADDPDQVTVPEEDVRRLFELCARMIPAVSTMQIHAVWSASRPLLSNQKGDNPYAISRTFDCIDHAQRDGIEGLITLVGGKATTMRAMAEKTADLICEKVGRKIQCRTRDFVLPSHRQFWRQTS